jgi:hypothetical protein
MPRYAVDESRVQTLARSRVLPPLISSMPLLLLLPLPLMPPLQLP